MSASAQAFQRLDVGCFGLPGHGRSDGAETQGDLLNVLGGGWDSITVASDRPDGIPDDAVAVVPGTLVARVLFHQITETNRDHRFSVTLVDEDGSEVGQLAGEFPVARTAGIPIGWPQNVNKAGSATGSPAIDESALPGLG